MTEGVERPEEEASDAAGPKRLRVPVRASPLALSRYDGGRAERRFVGWLLCGGAVVCLALSVNDFVRVSVPGIWGRQASLEVRACRLGPTGFRGRLLPDSRTSPARTVHPRHTCSGSVTDPHGFVLGEGRLETFDDRIVVGQRISVRTRNGRQVVYGDPAVVQRYAFEDLTLVLAWFCFAWAAMRAATSDSSVRPLVAGAVVLYAIGLVAVTAASSMQA